VTRKLSADESADLLVVIARSEATKQSLARVQEIAWFHS
jgi:hypothetical protein